MASGTAAGSVAGVTVSAGFSPFVVSLLASVSGFGGGGGGGII